MARKERGEFVFSAFSSFLLAWPVRRLVMHDRCRYMYSAGCTRSGAKHRWKSPLCLSSLPPPPSSSTPISSTKRKRGFVSHSFPDPVKGSCTRNPENWTERSVPGQPVPQMNDHLESHKPFFSATERIQRVKRIEKF